MYEITASILTTFLVKMLDDNLFPPGIHAPSELGIDPESVLNEILDKNSIDLTKNFTFHIK